MRADEVLVAVAANSVSSMEVLAADFTQKTGHREPLSPDRPESFMPRYRTVRPTRFSSPLMKRFQPDWLPMDSPTPIRFSYMLLDDWHSRQIHSKWMPKVTFYLAVIFRYLAIANLLTGTSTVQPQSVR